MQFSFSCSHLPSLASAVYTRSNSCCPDVCYALHLHRLEISVAPLSVDTEDVVTSLVSLYTLTLRRSVSGLLCLFSFTPLFSLFSGASGEGFLFLYNVFQIIFQHFIALSEDVLLTASCWWKMRIIWHRLLTWTCFREQLLDEKLCWIRCVLRHPPKARRKVANHDHFY